MIAFTDPQFLSGDLFSLVLTWDTPAPGNTDGTCDIVVDTDIGPVHVLTYTVDTDQQIELPLGAQGTIGGTYTVLSMGTMVAPAGFAWDIGHTGDVTGV